MIIMDLDGTLADCEHRRHFVDPRKNPNMVLQGFDGEGKLIEESGVFIEMTTGKRFVPNWKAFYEACDQDKPILPTCEILDSMMVNTQEIEIWSGRCESVRKKTEDWFEKNVRHPYLGWNFELVLKMRPIGDSTPDDELKERWLDEVLDKGEKIEFVFDDRPRVVKMWRRRGIFVFDCNQTGEEF